jgi:hypothetical protein
MTTSTPADINRLATLLERIEILANKIDMPFETDVGAKYIRVVDTSYSRSVHAFVDRETGDLLKAGGWKAPAKRKGGPATVGSLLNDDDFATILARADRYGGYLYKRP